MGGEGSMWMVQLSWEQQSQKQAERHEQPNPSSLIHWQALGLELEEFWLEEGMYYIPWLGEKQGRAHGLDPNPCQHEWEACSHKKNASNHKNRIPSKNRTKSNHIVWYGRRSASWEGATTITSVMDAVTIMRGSIARALGGRTHRFAKVWVITDMTGAWLPHCIISISFTEVTKVFSVWPFLSKGQFLMGFCVDQKNSFCQQHPSLVLGKPPCVLFAAASCLHCLQAGWSDKWQI